MMHQGTTTTARGRRERPVPPGPLQEFAQGLRDLRAAAGNPSYRAMERRAGYSSSALSAAAAGDRLPSLALTLAYVGACGGDQDAWSEKWHDLRADQDNTRPQETEAPAAATGRPVGSRADFGRTQESGASTAGVSEPWRESYRRPYQRFVKLSALLVALGVAVLATAGAFRQDVLFRFLSATGEAAQPARRPSETGQAGGSAGQMVEPGRQSAPAFTAVAGPSCPRDTTRSVRIEALPGRDGWKDAASSGWRGAGCGDGFLFSELRGDKRRGDERRGGEPAGPARRNVFQWRFTTGLPGPRHCALSVYIPKSGLAGQRVWYTVRDGFDEEARTVGEFTLDQRVRQGQWAPAPAPMVITGGLAMVEIADDGHGNTTGNQAMAAGPVRLSCP
ncbi:hypothetical protein ABZW11_43905 [Nonomuraea sp. NPDC004580]|uniref:hypothetical protein n=1 Tax=Nonomuraea sp. NPDC004580 TaxID=3154552 RepID=UPI00339E8D1B